MTLYSCAFSLDLSLLFLPSASLVRVVSLRSGQCVQLLCGHTADVTAVMTNSRNRLQLYSASLDGTVRLWDLHNGACLHVWTVGIPILNAVIAPSPAASAASASHKTDNAASAASRLLLGQGVLYLNVNRRAASSSSSNWHTAAAASRSCRLYSFDLASSRLHLLYKSRCCSHIALSPSCQFLASIAKHTLTLLHLPSGRKQKLAHSSNLTSLAFHPRDPYLATGDATGKIVLWYNCLPAAAPAASVSASAPSSSSPVVSLLHWHAHAVSCLSFTVDGSYLLSGGEEAVMVVWQLETGQKQFIPRLLAPLRSIVVSHDNLSYALLHDDNAVRIVSAVTSRITRCLQGLQCAHSLRLKQAEAALPPVLVPVPAAAAGGSSNSSVLLSGRSGFLQLFDPWSDSHQADVDVTERNLISRMDDELLSHYRVEHVAVSQQAGGWMMTVERRTDAEMSEKQSIKFWRFDQTAAAAAAAASSHSAASSPSPYALHSRIDAPHKQGIVDVSFHPSLPIAVTASADKTFKLWSLAAKPAAPARITATSSTSSRQSAASSSPSASESYWLCSAEGFYRDYAVHCAAFSSDGLLGVSYGQLLTVWALGGEQGEVLELRRTLLHSTPAFPVLHLCWAGKGGKVATATSEMLFMWDASTGSCDWSYRARVTRLCYDDKTGLLAVAVVGSKRKDEPGHSGAQEAKEALRDEKEAHDADDGEDGEGKEEGEEEDAERRQHFRGLFDSLVSHIVLFRPESSSPVRVWRVDDLRLHRHQQSTSLFTSTLCFLQPPAHAAHSSSSLLYLSKKRQLVRLDDIDSEEYAAQPQHGSDGSAPSLLPAAQQPVSLFERMYGKAALPASSASSASPIAPPPFLPPAAAAAASSGRGQSNALWSELFAGPSHLLPAMSALILPFMDSVMRKTETETAAIQNGKRAQAQHDNDMDEERQDRQQESGRGGSATVSPAEAGDVEATRALQRVQQEQDEALFRELTRDGLFPDKPDSYAAVAELWLQRLGQQEQGEQHTEEESKEEEEEQRRPGGAEAEAAASNAQDDGEDAAMLVEELPPAAAVRRPAGSKTGKTRAEKANGRSNGANGHDAAGAAVHGKENGSAASAPAAEVDTGGSKRRQTLPVQNGSGEQEVQPGRRKKSSNKSTADAPAGKGRRRVSD